MAEPQSPLDKFEAPIMVGDSLVPMPVNLTPSTAEFLEPALPEFVLSEDQADHYKQRADNYGLLADRARRRYRNAVLARDAFGSFISLACNGYLEWKYARKYTRLVGQEACRAAVSRMDPLDYRADLGDSGADD